MASAPEITKTIAAATDAVANAVTAAPKAAAATTAVVAEAVTKAMPATAPAKTATKAKRAAKPVAKRTKAVAKSAKPTQTKRSIKIVAAKTASKPKGKTMNDTVKTMTAQGEKIATEMKTRAEDAVVKGKQLFADWSDFSKGNVEALVESGKIAAKGFEKLGQNQADFARKSFEQTTTAFKGMAAVKSPTELMNLHNEYVRSTFDALVAQTSQSTEAMLKLAGEIAQPLSNRVAVAAQKVKLAA